MEAKRRFVRITWLILAWLAAGTLVSCTEPLLDNRPYIVVSPDSGEPGNRIAVTGRRFPATMLLSARLGPPSVGATPKSYGDVITDAQGSFTLTIVMPARWPDGAPIVEQDLVIVVLNQDGSIKATAPFTFTATAPTGVSPVLATAASGETAILTWHREGGSAHACDDLVVYADGRARISSCGAVEGRTVAARQLSDEQLASMLSWVASSASFEYEETTGVGEERVITRMTFAGKGSRQVSRAEKQVLLQFLGTLVVTH